MHEVTFSMMLCYRLLVVTKYGFYTRPVSPYTLASRLPAMCHCRDIIVVGSSDILKRLKTIKGGSIDGR